MVDIFKYKLEKIDSGGYWIVNDKGVETTLYPYCNKRYALKALKALAVEHNRIHGIDGTRSSNTITRKV